MKKILIGTMMILAISSTGFARMHDLKDDSTPVPPYMLKMRKGNCRTNSELERAKIMIEEKKLEIRKELLNDKPNWNKIEKLNIEIATQEAKNRTTNMRERFENSFTTQAQAPVSSNQ
ncbi:MAG: hypothetical protein IAA47_04750 [Candidatus Fusobacterium pullicola]|uniref:Uncharacterized protein n=1 Tax=Candidatus Fusobacterium pullicola TaxID=2838601 RepID=A0A9E2KYC4_9FUSO|nr:hypothetical protein [Candidatus Fusobacterium pullicola]